MRGAVGEDLNLQKLENIKSHGAPFPEKSVFPGSRATSHTPMCQPCSAEESRRMQSAQFGDM